MQRSPFEGAQLEQEEMCEAKRRMTSFSSSWGRREYLTGRGAKPTWRGRPGMVGERVGEAGM